VTSIEILREVSRVLHYPRIQEQFKPRKETLRRFFRLVFRKAIITRDTYQTDRITQDPTDNKFLACALEGRAHYILSRDQHIKNLKQFQGIPIIDVKTFLEKIQKKG
jgi:putative PIN family toxin of toxin-antitoxin system